MCFETAVFKMAFGIGYRPAVFQICSLIERRLLGTGARVGEIVLLGFDPMEGNWAQIAISFKIFSSY